MRSLQFKLEKGVMYRWDYRKKEWIKLYELN